MFVEKVYVFACRQTNGWCCYGSRVFTVGRLRSVFRKRLRSSKNSVNVQNALYVGHWLSYCISCLYVEIRECLSLKWCATCHELQPQLKLQQLMWSTHNISIYTVKHFYTDIYWFTSFPNFVHCILKCVDFLDHLTRFRCSFDHPVAAYHAKIANLTRVKFAHLMTSQTQ